MLAAFGQLFKKSDVADYLTGARKLIITVVLISVIAAILAGVAAYSDTLLPLAAKFAVTYLVILAGGFAWASIFVVVGIIVDCLRHVRQA